MPLQKLQTVDGFVVRDFDDGPAAGTLRVGKKILQAGARDLARSATYTYASFGLRWGGGSAGLNAIGDAVAGSLDSMVAELSDGASAGSLQLLAGKGADPVATEPLRSHGADATDSALVAGVIAAATWALGGSVEARKFAIEQSDASPAPPALRGALIDAGATVIDATAGEGDPSAIWRAEVDVILAGSRPGVLAHTDAASVAASAIVPWGPLPVTTRALATLLQNEIVYVPDFVSASGGLLLLAGSDGANGDAPPIAGKVTALLDEVAADAGQGKTDEALFLRCVARAEAFLSTWRQEALFGRPLA